MGVKVAGVSFDSSKANAKFKAAEKFEFPLWSDLGRELALTYGAATSSDEAFADRITVVLDPNGEWVLEYPSSDVNFTLTKHAGYVLADLQKLLASR